LRRRGRAAANAARELANPYRYPDALRYLHEYAQELHGRSGITPEVGVKPLTWPVLHAWMQATGRDLTVTEQRALLEIDAALAYRGDK
jgi:hypothetical protein